jgi:hypothetical protein
MNTAETFRDSDDALAQLDGRGSDAEWRAVKYLTATLGDRMPSVLLMRYRESSLAGARASCVFHSTRYARTEPAAVELGLLALTDRAKKVRYRACELLAYAQKSETLANLRQTLKSATGDFRADVLAAIDAIESHNHHFFVDREHSGKVTWNIV